MSIIRDRNRRVCFVIARCVQARDRLSWMDCAPAFLAPAKQSSNSNPLMWQTYVRNWLVGKLRERMSEQARGATPQPPPAQDAPPATPRPAGPPVACHVGVIVGQRSEAAGLIDRMAGVVETLGDGFVAHEGSLAGRRVAIIAAGPGAAAARQGTLAMRAGHRPQWIIAAGFATALVPDLQVGDIVMADRLATLADPVPGGELTVDFQIDPAALATSRHLRVGRLLTVQRPLTDAREKQLLADRHSALAADRQSASVADVCREQRVRFLAIRAILEPCKSLPVEVDNVVRQRSWPGRIGAVAAAMFHRPSSLPELWRRGEDSLVAGERLGQFLAGIIEQLD
jgi:adenosylhomocysteine nucleosidase